MVFFGLNISERRVTRGSGTSTTAVWTSKRPAEAVVGAFPRVTALKMVVFPDCGSPMIPSLILTLVWGICYTSVDGPKWRNRQTRTTQNRVPSGLWVRFPPSALTGIISCPPAAAGERRVPGMMSPGYRRETAARRSRASLSRCLVKQALFLLLIDLVVLVAYPILYVKEKMRRFFGLRR